MSNSKKVNEALELAFSKMMDISSEEYDNLNSESNFDICNIVVEGQFIESSESEDVSCEELFMSFLELRPKFNMAYAGQISVVFKVFCESYVPRIALV